MQEYKPQIPLKVESLVLKALSGAKLSALTDVLKSIAETVDAYGCVLWQVNRPSKQKSSADRLFVISEWFRDDRSFALHDLPLHESATGIAALRGRTVNIEDIWRDPRVYTKDPFLSHADIKSMCCVPIRFRDGAIGCLNIYRTNPPGFSPDDVVQVEMLATLVPYLYQAIRDEVSLSLVASVTKLLYSAEGPAQQSKDKSDETPVNELEMKRMMKNISRLIGDCFQSIETSIFLENRLIQPEEFDLTASTWSRRFKKRILTKQDKGTTAWILREGRPVRLFDLAHFARDRDLINAEYPNLEWGDSMEVAKMIPDSLKARFGGQMPPLSFMAAPIMNRGKVYGVIRCAVAERSPYYFTERDLALLQLIATQVGHWWSDWLSKCELVEERIPWRSFVKGIGDLNRFVGQQLKSGNVDLGPIFDKALLLARETIEGSEILDIRLIEPNEPVLKFVRTLGVSWNEGEKADIEKRLEKTFRVDEHPPKSAGAHVFQTGETYVISDARANPTYYDPTFSQTTGLVLAPIRVQDDIIGVLDVRSTRKKPFPRYAEYMAAVLGQQLGLYHYLRLAVEETQNVQAELRDQAKTLERLQTEQTQTFQDLTHQFRTPIRQANAWLTEAIENIKLDNQLRPLLQRVRGLSAKAQRVSTNTELFADLARGAHLELKESSIRLNDLLRLLKEANQDAKNLVDAKRNIQFYVDEPSFTNPKKRVRFIHSLFVDRNLLEQALGDLLENAAKYSYRDTEVRVYGGWTSAGRFHISVENEGIPISLSESKVCCDRGWQGELAKETGQGGKGIGLWIVSCIMRSHQGELQVLPTEGGITSMRMIFPEERIQ